MSSSSRPSATPGPWPADWLRVDLGEQVGACMTARSLGAPGVQSHGSYEGFNLGTHVGDAPDAVAAHRRHVESLAGSPALWMNQIHGNTVVRATPQAAVQDLTIDADGCIATEPGVVCTVMVADCLPILLAAPGGCGVGALHAGWRGLAGAGAMAGRGIVESGISALCEATGSDPQDLQAWLGPCIGPQHFEVGADVLLGFGVDPAHSPGALAGESAARFRFHRMGADGLPRWLADLPGLAQDRLKALGVQRISGGQWCTVSDPSRFYSFRRDRVTGRQAACIWLR